MKQHSASSYMDIHSSMDQSLYHIVYVHSYIPYCIDSYPTQLLGTYIYIYINIFLLECTHTPTNDGYIPARSTYLYIESFHKPNMNLYRQHFIFWNIPIQVISEWNAGNHEEAHRASRLALIWGLASLITGIAIYIGLIIFLIVFLTIYLG